MRAPLLKLRADSMIQFCCADNRCEIMCLFKYVKLSKEKRKHGIVVALALGAKYHWAFSEISFLFFYKMRK